MQTPSFLVWALERHCPLRQIAGWQDPERTERLLRAARAFDEAAGEGRILDGVCVAQGDETQLDASCVRAFRASEALAVYSGEANVRAACRDCPANALRGHRGRTVVGCFGMWPLPDDLNEFCRQMDAVIAAVPEIETAIPAVGITTPRWYGLWLDTPLRPPVAAAIAEVLRGFEFEDPASAAGRDELVLALEAAARGSPLHVRLYPPGSVDGPWWNLVPHCARCHAPWAGDGNCRVCGQTNRPAPSQKRHVRGTRPYQPLARLLGQEKSAEFMVRYRALRQGPS